MVGCVLVDHACAVRDGTRLTARRLSCIVRRQLYVARQASGDPLYTTAPDTRIDCATANAALEPLSALERIRWAVDALGDDVVLLSSMQKTAVVLMHLFHRLGLSNEVLFVDTGYHFFETLKMRDVYMRRYRLNVVTLYPASTIEEQETLHGSKLFATVAGQPECCRMRKEAPLLAHLETKRAPVLVNGLRRAEGGKRGHIKPFSRGSPHGRLPAVAALRLER